jgi:uncharacterized DUF497 family protein
MPLEAEAHCGDASGKKLRNTGAGGHHDDPAAMDDRDNIVEVGSDRHNKEKHGIDFVEAQALWLDVDRVEIPAQTVDEPRTLVIGRIQGQRWSVVVTYRKDRIRIISARRSRTEEAEIYEGEGL